MRMIFRAMLVAVGIGLAGPLSASATPLDRLAVDRAPSASETLQAIKFNWKGTQIPNQRTQQCIGINGVWVDRNLLGQIVSTRYAGHHGRCSGNIGKR